MKSISRKEFQDAYMSPTAEQTARMQAKLHWLQAESEDRRQVRWAKPRIAFVMAAVLLVAGIITAVATNTTRYATTWGAEVKEYEQTASDVEWDDFEEGIPAEMLEKRDKALEDGFFTNIVGNNGGMSIHPRQKLESEAEMIAMLDAHGFPHPASLIPEGYQFVQGEAFYNIRSNLNVEDYIVGCMFRGPYSLYIYDIEPEDRYISSYNVTFADEKNPDTGYHIDASLSQTKISTFFFSTDEEYKTENLSVPGMEEAFSLRTTEETRLNMCRKIRKDETYLAGKMADLLFSYQIISAEGPIDDVVKMYAAWE